MLGERIKPLQERVGINPAETEELEAPKVDENPLIHRKITVDKCEFKMGKKDCVNKAVLSVVLASHACGTENGNNQWFVWHLCKPHYHLISAKISRLMNGGILKVF